MAVFKCKVCGGDLLVDAGNSIAGCEYCGTQQTVPTTQEERLQNLFNRATSLRRKCDFDRAQDLFAQIVGEDNSDAEAYWGLVLCRYGIEYVEDVATRRHVPTCHRTEITSVLADVDYLAAIENADANQKSIYEREAREIDALQKDILKIAGEEKPFDVFICYKETDEVTKQRTQDSVMANDMYHQLTAAGYKVFFSAITLEGKLGQAYEPYIFAALNSARVMLVVGSKPEYFKATWVKNEWSRYLKRLSKDRSLLLIPCYRDMDPYDLPDEFAHLQAQDMSKIGFMQDILRGIKKVLVKENEAAPVAATVSAPKTAGVAPLLRRAALFLEDEEFDRVTEFCDRALDMDPECAEAYLYLAMADYGVSSRDNLANCDKLMENSNFKKALRFSTGDFHTELEGYEATYNARIQKEFEENTAAYNAAVETMKAERFQEAFEMFSPILHFSNSVKLRQICVNEIEYREAKRNYAAGNYRDAYLAFSTLASRNYRDSQRLYEETARKNSALVYIQSALGPTDKINGYTLKMKTKQELKDFLKSLEQIPEYIHSEKLISTIKRYQLRQTLTPLIIVAVLLAAMALMIGGCSNCFK